MLKWIAGVMGMLWLVSTGAAQEVYVDNVVMVLDASGSMDSVMNATQRKKIDAAKMAIKDVLQTIPQTTQVGLLVFGGQANGWVYELGGRDDATLLPAIDRVSAGGGTPLGAFMKIGADRLLEARKAQYGYGSYRLLVVTDGEANDANLVERFTPDIIARGIITDVIGVDMAKAHTLATRVHSYRSANDPASLKAAIQAVFAEVGRTDEGQAGETAFEELAGFPAGLAMAVISAQASSGNHPIGEQAASAVASVPAESALIPAAAAVPPAPVTPPTVTPPAAAQRGLKINVPVIVTVFAAVFLWRAFRRHRRG